MHFLICNCDLFTCDFISWNGLDVGLWNCSHGMICSACDTFVCVMLHMNGFHAYTVWLWYVIPICIHSKLYLHPLHHVNSFIKLHVNKSQSQTKKRTIRTSLCFNFSIITMSGTWFKFCRYWWLLFKETISANIKSIHFYTFARYLGQQMDL